MVCLAGVNADLSIMEVIRPAHDAMAPMSERASERESERAREQGRESERKRATKRESEGGAVKELEVKRPAHDQEEVGEVHLVLLVRMPPLRTRIIPD